MPLIDRVCIKQAYHRRSWRVELWRLMSIWRGRSRTAPCRLAITTSSGRPVACNGAMRKGRRIFLRGRSINFLAGPIFTRLTGLTKPRIYIRNFICSIIERGLPQTITGRWALITGAIMMIMNTIARSRGNLIPINIRRRCGLFHWRVGRISTVASLLFTLS